MESIYSIFSNLILFLAVSNHIVQFMLCIWARGRNWKKLGFIGQFLAYQGFKLVQLPPHIFVLPDFGFQLCDSLALFAYDVHG